MLWDAGKSRPAFQGARKEDIWEWSSERECGAVSKVCRAGSSAGKTV